MMIDHSLLNIQEPVSRGKIIIQIQDGPAEYCCGRVGLSTFMLKSKPQKITCDIEPG
jgi:hypothetical protein